VNERPVVGFPGYFVSDEGRVFSDLQEPHRELKFYEHDGYWRAQLLRDGKRVQRFVHCLVLEAFVGSRPHSHETRHLDGNRKNNALANLCWGTCMENTDDRRRHGTIARAERNGKAQLTAEQVRKIRASPLSERKLAAECGVGRMAVHYARRRETWRELP
jgi:hypothetical protein